MIKLSEIMNPQFTVSFGKLMEASLSGRTMLRLKRIAKRMGEERALYEETRKQICTFHAEKYENGDPKIKGGNFDILPENMIALNMQISDLMATEFELDPAGKIPFAEVEKANLTAMDLIVLDSLIDEPTE